MQAQPGLSRRSLLAALAAAPLSATLLSACGSDEPAAAGQPLRIGYQRFGGLSLVKARNAADPKATWSLFESGPALTEGLKGKAIDIGQTGEAPPIFAAAGKIDFKIIGTSAPVPKGEAVLVKQAKGFKTFADLKGKRVALNKGSNVNWLLVKLLEKHNLKITDIDVKYLKPAEARPAFDGDQVDAWIIWDPYFALAEQPGVAVLEDATGLASNREYLLVDPTALEQKTDQLGEFLKQYRTVTDWGIANPAERAAVLAPELKIPLDVTTRALERSAQPLAAITPEIGDELQAIADGFAALQLIPEKIDIKSRIDGRFNEALR